MITLIVGQRSNLTKYLNKVIQNNSIISSKDILNNNFKRKIPKKFNLIINLFYPSSKLDKDIDYKLFFDLNFSYLNKFFSQINKDNINKIIYTSSSSINSNFLNHKKHKNLYSISKLLAENYIQNINISEKKVIIARVYNMFDENESFSVISKIINANKNKKILKLNNKGEAIRDFIHSGDVAKIYKKLLKSKFSGTVDIGSGNGYRIIDIVKSTNTKFRLNKEKIIEQNISVANLTKIKNLTKNISFYSLESFLKKKKILVSKLNKLNFNFPNDYQTSHNSIIIYGAGYSGKKLCDEFLKKNNNLNLYFVDDDEKKVGKFYKKVPIINFNNFQKIHKLLNITNLIIAIPSLNYDLRKKIISKISNFSKNISILPPKEEIINKTISINDLRNISFRDFFDRNTSKINKKLISYLYNKNILITGGAGSIGSELAYQICNAGSKKVIIYDNNETELFRTSQNITNKNAKYVLGDINDKEYLKKIIKKNKIQHVFHAAAYKHLNILENNFENAIKNNLFGTLNVLNSLNDNVKSFVLISTDKAVNPKSYLGISKRLAEIITQNWKKNRTSIVRFGNVFGSRGSVLEVFFNQIHKNIPLTITNKSVSRYFMSIKEACNLVLQTNSLDNKNGIFILDMGKPIKILEIAKSLLKFLNLENYPIHFTKLNKGEKISESLSLSKTIFKTKHKDIFFVREKNYNIQNIAKLISYLEKNINSISIKKFDQKISNFLKN